MNSPNYCNSYYVNCSTITEHAVIVHCNTTIRMTIKLITGKLLCSLIINNQLFCVECVVCGIRVKLFVSDCVPISYDYAETSCLTFSCPPPMHLQTCVLSVVYLQSSMLFHPSRCDMCA